MAEVMAVPIKDLATYDSAWRKKAAPTLNWAYPGSETELAVGAAHYTMGEQGKQPRHRHVQEQIRVIFSGSMTYGRNQVARAGDVVYFPESVPYGPVSYEEGEMLVLQWAGPSPVGDWFSHDQLVPASMALVEATGGEFDKSRGGQFVHPDGRVQDGHQAIVEFIIGKPLQFAPPRYDDIVSMHTTEYPSVEVEGAPGVRVKHLGYFNEVGPNLKVLELDAGASLPPAVARSQQLWDVMSGQISYQGVDYPRQTLVHVSPGVERGVVRAEEPTQIFVLHLRHPGIPMMPFSEY